MVMTSFPEQATRDAAHRAGANIVIDKPFDLEALVAHARGLLHA
jgi:DNA-binding response OmpR family regulator